MPDKKLMKEYNNRVVNICLVGPSGSGKTSLLATMHNVIQDAFRGLVFDPVDDVTFTTLNEKYMSLSRQAKTPAAQKLVNEDQGTVQITEYTFRLDYKPDVGEKEKICLVNFFDSPGVFVSQMRPEVIERIKDADIVIYTLDTGAMVASDPSAAERYNGYNVVRRMLEKYFLSDTKKNKLLLITPIKCEKWTRNRDNKNILEQNLNEFAESVDKNLMSIFNLFEKKENALALLCPVETMGSIEFSFYNDEPEELRYIRIPGKTFKPKFVDAPLVFALEFIIGEWGRNRGFFERRWDRYVGDFYKNVLRAMADLHESKWAEFDKTILSDYVSGFGNLELLNPDI